MKAPLYLEEYVNSHLHLLHLCVILIKLDMRYLHIIAIDHL